jgi:hypothetical protein
MSFDIVIPAGPNDIQFINLQIEFTKKNIIDYRNIYIVSCNPDILVDGCITINENIFPFNIADVENILGKESRKNWYFQQILKFYSVFLIPDVMDRVLILDSDTYFLKPTRFIDDDGVCLYNPTDEYHIPYFEHMSRFHPVLEKMIPNFSGITHHMMFEKKYLNELFELIESYHKIPFWEAFLKCVTEYNTSGASEYEIYFNYMLKIHPQNIKIRHLSRQDIRDIRQVHHYNLDFVNWHWHSR